MNTKETVTAEGSVLKVLTYRSQIRDVAQRWHNQYGWSTNPNIKNIGKRLSQLDAENATAEDVAEIIGHSSWVGESRCDVCVELYTTVVVMGEEPNYESSTVAVCRGCLKRALDAISQEEDV